MHWLLLLQCLTGVLNWRLHSIDLSEDRCLGKAAVLHAKRFITSHIEVCLLDKTFFFFYSSGQNTSKHLCSSHAHIYAAFCNTHITKRYCATMWRTRWTLYPITIHMTLKRTMMVSDTCDIETPRFLRRTSYTQSNVHICKLTFHGWNGGHCSLLL